jgi:hypothetical protein
MKRMAPLFVPLVLVCGIVFSVWSSSALAACHTVNPASAHNGDGTTWNAAASGGAAGAFNALPASLIRGDIYYLADGSYPAYTFNAAASGTTTVEIRKAQSYDHCTDTGWNAGTMGSAQAAFSRVFSVSSNYLIVNGNGQQTAQGCGGAPGSTVASAPPSPSDCGIKIDNTCSGGADACDGLIFVTNPATNYEFRYVELVGNGDNSSDKMEVFAPYGGTASTFTHVYGHNAGCVYFQDGGDGRTVSLSYFWGTEVNGAAGGCHGQYSFYSSSDSNGVEHDNVYRDITGTAVWTFATPAGTHNNWAFYNDVIWNSSTFTGGSLSLGWVSDGVMACINPGVNCTNFSFIQNTVVNAGDASGINNENTGSYTVQNNVWYNIKHGTISFNMGTGGTYAQDHNSFLASGTSCPSGASNVCDNSPTNPFVGWTTGDFNIASENADWTSRIALGSPYTTDANGITRTTDRGAYQYCMGSSCGPALDGGVAPAAPSGLTATVK